MKFISIVSAAALAVAAGASFAETITGSGNPVTQERPAAGFTGIGVSIPGRVEVVQGATEGVRITADDNVLPEIESRVERGVLRLKLRDGVNVRRATIRVVVNARVVESLGIAGSAEVRAPSLESSNLKVSIAGSGDAHVGGRAEALRVDIAGSGDVKAERLATQRTSVSISGSGDATVWAREALNVSVAGSGDVRYYGDPAIRKSIVGSGSVRRLGGAPS